MSNKTALFGAFVAGAAAGALATYKFVKDKYEKLAKAEAESFEAKLKEMRKNEKSPMVESAPNEEPNKKISSEIEKEAPESVRRSYEKIVRESGYTDYSAISQGKPASDPTPVLKEVPQVIDPDEFGEYDDYREMTLLYFTDHVLSDKDGNIISTEEAEELLGPVWAQSFGEYEEDAVHIRNDAHKCYYEVIMESRLYSDMLRKKPYLMDDDTED